MKLDPDGLADLDLPVAHSCQWQGWDCTEGWVAHQMNDDLVLNWYRNAYGHRHSRDLWLVAIEGYFSE